MTDQKKKQDQPESPLAKAVRTGTLGGAKKTAEPAVTHHPEKAEQEQSKKISEQSTIPNKGRKRLTGYVSPDIHKWTKMRKAIEDREISEIMEDALRLYKAKVEP